MADAAKTPVPGVSRDGRGLRVSWSVLWGAVVIAATVATGFVYATKAELAEHAALEAKQLADHATEEARIAADLATKTALHGKELEQHDRLIERAMDYLEAVNTNQATMMREVAVPEKRIAKPPRETP